MAEHNNEKSKTFSESEEEILAYWEKNKIFEASLKRAAKRPPFIFYEGPPSANGRPGLHHVISRAFKDVIPRYKSMRGFFVARKAGWDTQGLPVEMEVEKKLGVHSKKEIEENVGVERFVEEARKSVFDYKDEWEKMTRRMGYWLDMEHPYVTMSNEYLETLWWVFANIAHNGYLYKDYKILPWCPRCGTSLSSHELALGYKTVKDESVYVKFPVARSAAGTTDGSAPKSLGGDAYFLVWTTTPWTLPGNVALAVNPKATYAVVEKDGEILILARERLSVLGDGYSVMKEETGDKFAGLTYEPLYRSPSMKVQVSSYKVVKGDFVTTTDGTGIVHIAPAFGADDQRVGRESGLPTLATTDEAGRMATKGYAWDGKAFKDADPLIIEDLKKRGLLYKTETIEHEYPFCWRCGSALMYFARDSWFFKTTAVKKRMLDENAKIRWQPPFLRDGRFGEWLRENVDWAISRERYWGMPLPVWQCKRCKHETIVGSLDALDAKAPKTSTKIFLLRHGEAKHNVKKLVGPWSQKADAKNDLTSKGEKQIERAGALLKNKNIDVILSSPLKRARQTAEIVAEALGGVRVEFRDGLREFCLGDLEGITAAKLHKTYPYERFLVEPFPGGESLRQVRARMVAEWKTILKEYDGKRVLIVSHGDPLWVLAAGVGGVPESGYRKAWYPKTGEVHELPAHNWPYNRHGELDMHRPYIDKVMLACEECDGEMQRVREVADVWFDSGAMPYAQNAGFQKKLSAFPSAEEIVKAIPYPADYIAEAVDQTRGWFYTLLAVASLLELPAPFRNVLTLGLVLDPKGEKMSKSRGNAVEPKTIFDKYGADAARWYFFTVNHAWDEKRFREADVQDAARRFLNILWNSFTYWKTYAVRPAFKALRAIPKPKLLINRWLAVRVAEVASAMADALDAFDATRAARVLEQFVTEDLSRWYIRRVRDTMRSGSREERAETSAALGAALLDCARFAAPFTPFLAERIYREGGGKEKSVHREHWPKLRALNGDDKKLLQAMADARDVVSRALEARAKAGIKVRQPLSRLAVKSAPWADGLAEIVRGEVNVKEITFDVNVADSIRLDTVITPALKEEGDLRDAVRAIQEERKKSRFRPRDKIVLVAAADEAGKAFLRRNEEALKRDANLASLVFDERDAPAGKPRMAWAFHV